MGLAKTEAEIAERVSRYIKAELKRADVTYEELAKRLKNRACPTSPPIRSRQN
jgi:ribosome-binding protein aMBF1 (putative translation factor)